jgi:4-hydroxy-tetrahydrodipicolinate reductase
MQSISVIVHGALGKMGREIVSAVSRDPELNLTGTIDITADSDSLSFGNSRVALYKSLDELLVKARPQAMVDFSIAEASIAAARIAAPAHIDLIIGSTGFSAEQVKEFDRLAKDNNIGIIISPNFAMGAVVLMHLAALAAKYFESAEIIELHHDEKVDAPSGTALATAREMLKSRSGRPFKYAAVKKDNLKGSRGGELDGIGIHSVRLPGFVASEEVIFGMQGQTLKLRHDAINRECYMPGIILAIKEVSKYRGSVHSLEDILKLGGI